jgi:hypothetical protein
MHFASGERFRALAMLHAGQAQGLLGMTRRSICVMVGGLRWYGQATALMNLFAGARTPVADKGANVYPYLTACPACRNYMNIRSEYGISTPKSKSLPDMKPGGRVSALLNARLFKRGKYIWSIGGSCSAAGQFMHM